ncbi:MAG: hypothetical protein DMG40_19075 [Acidobacteria bacterium]|nr:MAG: hypothetical protein DMG40_19075 [Acidobacteriota bacterium]
MRTWVSAIIGASSFTNARTSGANLEAACAAEREGNNDADSNKQKAGNAAFRMGHSEGRRLSGVSQFMHPEALKQERFT